jgi:hypothetical protein
LRRARSSESRSLLVANSCRVSALIIRATLLLAVVGRVSAQPLRPPPTAAAVSVAGAPGSELTIYLMTMGPGDEVWEKFGHNAIWIHDDLRKTDVAYNWGLFDFAAADFFPRFLKGNMRYWMGGFDQQATLDFYRRGNRTVWAQELSLRPAERVELARFVEWNARPENRFYNYDYFRDNCSTRVRDVLDRAVGGAIRGATDRAPSGTTYRFHTRRLTQDEPWIYLGTLLGLGEPVDRQISRWEEMFLPVRLHDDIRNIRVRDANGELVPLVRSEHVLFAATREAEGLEPATHIGAYLIAGMLVAFVALLLRHLSDNGSHGARTALLVVGGVWNLVVGIAGTGLAALWTLTNHIYSYQNENLLQANPLSLVLAVMILASLGRRMAEPGDTAVGNPEPGRSRPGAGKRGASKSRDQEPSATGFVGRRTSQLAWIVAALALLGLVIQIMPAFNQVNGEIIGLMLPAHLGIALALARRSVWPASRRKVSAATH